MLRLLTSALGNLWTLPNTVLGFFIGLCLAWSLPRMREACEYLGIPH